MKGLLHKDKKGISIMIGYVLLVVIAVGIGAMVFAYLRYYVPSDRPVCPDNAALSIESMSCNNGVVEITFMNRGLFNLDGAYVRIGDPNREFKELLGDDPLFTEIYVSGGLLPGDTYRGIYTYSGTGTRELEVEPALFVENEWVLCNEAIIRQDIECGNNPAWVIINKPVGIVALDDIDVDIVYQTINTLQTCYYNITDVNGIVGTNVNVPCNGQRYQHIEDNIPGLNAGVVYDLNAYVEDDLGNAGMDVSQFSVEEDPSDFTINWPGAQHEFLNQVLDGEGWIRLQYQITGSPSSCSLTLYDPFDNVVGSPVSGPSWCAVNRNNVLGEDKFIEELTYRLEFQNDDTLQQWSHEFDVLIYPDIDITRPGGVVNICDEIPWEFTPTERKHPLDNCILELWNSTTMVDSIEILNCGPGTESGTLDAPNGNYRLDGYVYDDLSNEGNDTISFTVSGGANCNSGSFGEGGFNIAA